MTSGKDDVDENAESFLKTPLNMVRGTKYTKLPFSNRFKIAMTSSHRWVALLRRICLSFK